MNTKDYDNMMDAKMNEYEEDMDRREAEFQEYVENNQQEVAGLIDTDILLEEYKTRELDDCEGLTKVYFHAHTWADCQGDISLSEYESERALTLGHTFVVKPEFPEDNVWRLMKDGHNLEQAKLAVAQCSKALDKAKDDLAKLTCLEHITD